MALDFSALQTEFFARGFSDLNDGSTGLTRAKRWLVDATHEIDDMADWPYLITSTTKNAFPATISDLGTIRAVTDVASQYTLQPADLRWLRELYGDLSTAGTATFYYLTDATSFSVYPLSTATLTIDYLKASVDLSAGSDTPLMPDRYRMAVVHYAVAAAREDRGDAAGAQSARAQGDVVVARMGEKLLARQHQGPDQFWPAVGQDC